MESTLERTEPSACREEPGASAGDIICFVCTGNTCRSPMAAALFNDLTARHGSADGVRDMAISAGISAFPGMPMTEEAIHALEDYGVTSTPQNDYQHHTAQRIDERTIAVSAKVIAMTSAHAMQLIGAFPQFADKIYTLPEDIADPFGGGAEEYRACLEQIAEGLRRAFPTLGTD